MNTQKQRYTLRQQITALLEQAFCKQDPQGKVSVKKTSVGWIYILVVSSTFRGLPLEEREEKVDTILANIDMTLANFPILRYDLVSPEEEIPTIMPQIPVWSEILMLPTPEPDPSIDLDNERKPLIVTFYSFKGGVGRTTALGLIAGILASQEHRIVMIDFDLEAPGLSFLFSPLPEYGVLDYLHQRILTPEENIPAIEECVQQIEIPSRGELYLIPAGEYDEADEYDDEADEYDELKDNDKAYYVHRLADLDLHVIYNRPVNPIHQLLDDTIAYLNPDIILIDARPGFSELGAVALLDRADMGVMCFAPTEQNFAGLSWAVQAAKRQYIQRGKPDMRFLLTPMPEVPIEQQEIWIAQTEDWITEHWGIPETLTIQDLYATIPYNTYITVIRNLVEKLPTGMLGPYMSIADAISASLPNPIPKQGVTKTSTQYKRILHELRFATTPTQEMQPKDIPDMFQKTGDFDKFLDDHTWLVRGAKGTGKSLLFRLFVENPKEAIKFASFDPNYRFIPAHGSQTVSSTLLNSNDFQKYEEEVGDQRWNLFWQNYALLQVCAALPEMHDELNIEPDLHALATTSHPESPDIISWLATRPRGDITLKKIDRWLKEKGQKIWVLYDELDISFGQDYTRQKRSLEALLLWWIEYGYIFTNIIPKILLREDIWNKLNFTNKTHYSRNRTVRLRWEEDDLWRLVLRQALRSSQTLNDIVRSQYGVISESLDYIEQEQLRKGLYPLWGERMGRSKKAYTYNWVRTRITDAQDNRFPRSLILLLQHGVENEKRYTEDNNYNAVVRPKALIDALPLVSQERVDAVRDEYPEFANHFAQLKGETSPIDLQRLGEVWKLQETEVKEIISHMQDIGIVQQYFPNAETNSPRYSVVELYLYGLGMVRKGPR